MIALLIHTLLVFLIMSHSSLHTYIVHPRVNIIIILLLCDFIMHVEHYFESHFQALLLQSSSFFFEKRVGLCVVELCAFALHITL